MTGNPGVSKSWKFIQFCYPLDLFDIFSPFKEKLLGDLEEDKPFLKGLKSVDQKSAKRVQKEAIFVILCKSKVYNGVDKLSHQCRNYLTCDELWSIYLNSFELVQ